MWMYIHTPMYKCMYFSIYIYWRLQIYTDAFNSNPAPQNPSRFSSAYSCLFFFFLTQISCSLFFHSIFFFLKKNNGGLPWWHSGWESACQCKGHGFDPWSGRTPHATEQLSPCAATAEPALWSPWATTAEAHMPRARALQQERPQQWEGRAPQGRVAPTHRNGRGPARSNEDPTQPKINK